MKWLSKKEVECQPLSKVLEREQLNIIEDKLDFLINTIGKKIMSALDDLKAEVGVAITDIGALATLINAKVAGTADSDLAALTASLKTATDAVVAILSPPVVAPVAPAPVVDPAAPVAA